MVMVRVMAGRRVRPSGAEAANCNRGELKLDSPDHPTKPLFSGEWEQEGEVAGNW
jgi:hypothetical protein